jgi:hypothetical protein
MSVYRLKGTSGSVANQAYRIVEKLVIGRADDCDIRIDDSRVDAHHAEICLTPEGQVVLVDLSSRNDQRTGGGVRLNGEEVSRADLASGDEIHIGNCRLMLQAPGLRPDRVLDGEAILPGARNWPWLLPIALGALAFHAYRNGWLSTLSGILGV